MTIVVPYHQDERLVPGTLPVAGRVVSPALPDGDRWSRMVTLWDAVASEVAGTSAPVVVSGDCLVALGVLAGVQRAGLDPSLLWFDAHGDVHTLESSTSGYLGGLALRLALGAHADRVASPLGLRPLTEDRVTLVDARDLDPAEVEYLTTSEVRHCQVTDVVAPDGPVVLHVDLDVIDPEDLPGQLIPAPGGPPTDAVVESVRRIVATGRVVALDIACTWHPDDDPRRAELLTALIGQPGTTPPER